MKTLFESKIKERDFNNYVISSISIDKYNLKLKKQKRIRRYECKKI